MDDLELMAMRWLRFKKACPVVLFERSPRGGHGEPDVLGITKSRYLLEIEVKRSLSDFKANSTKPHIHAHSSLFCLENGYTAKWPKQFWYLVSQELAVRVELLIPDWCGLMRGPVKGEQNRLYVIKPAPTNKDSARLTAKEMMKLGKCMSNQMLSQVERLHALHLNWRYGYEPYYDGAIHFEI